MLKSKIFIHFLMIMLAADLANAATIHGTVYDLSLKKLNNVRVEVNTSPKQFMIAQNGSYSFNVPYGAYTLKAQLMQRNNLIASSEENITIRQDGNYVLDIILFPNIEEGVENIDIDVGSDITKADDDGVGSIFIIIAILFSLFAVLGLFYLIKNKKQAWARKKKEESGLTREEMKSEQVDDLSQMLKIIKHDGGRTTQKGIRKQIPLSEAKISLMIAELEHRGVIEKIKKGRGNIIILKKK